MMTSSALRLKIKITWTVIFVLILASLVILDLYIHDFRTVIPNQVYRSRQLSKQQFSHVIDQYHLKSILNLRGAHPGNVWYDNEVAISKTDHVKHYNIALQSDVLPTSAQLKKLVRIIETAPRPILVHCESGVDRSGLASAVSVILANQSLQKAKKQVSWEYFVLHHESVGKQFLRRYEAWLKKNQLTTSKQHFLQWLAQYR